MSWIYYDTEVSNRGEVTEGSLCSSECEVLGRRLVDKYLFAIPGSSLLHYALTNFFIGEDQEINDNLFIHDKYPDISKVIEALIHWGAYKVIDWPNSEGLRPIHVAIETSNKTTDGNIQELTSLLVSKGAHLDAACEKGTHDSNSPAATAAGPALPLVPHPPGAPPCEAEGQGESD